MLLLKETNKKQQMLATNIKEKQAKTKIVLVSF